ncbi:hypothetical protein AB0D59_19290 [Streptomyces sp. NPDC048417]|uniref:hypothetical protein n=1 Tax=Streptomyces sp. NPDC048417 TaxID=3155387 RepID=UPI003429FE85
MNATARPPTSGEPAPAESAYELRLGETVEDAEHRRIGKVMGLVGGYVQLRPIEGGREWDADPKKLRLVPVGEALSPAVAIANARSRGGLW